MTKYGYTLRLLKDAELGTGLGGEMVNDLVPRGRDGFPLIPASHIKGLMRASLREISTHRPEWKSAFGKEGEFESPQCVWPDVLLEKVFGSYDETDRAYEANLRLEDAQLPLERRGPDAEPLETKYVARTQLEPNGTAKDNSLRTSEAIPTGTEFRGHVYSDTDMDSIEGIAWRLALTSVAAVGGSRNRGGQCVVELDGKAGTESPGKLLLALDNAIQNQRFDSPRTISGSGLDGVNELSSETCILELLFVADSPICCPERPDKANVIVSGFSIPASTVQGVLLNHINRRNTNLATDLFESPKFRCWPLNPCIDPRDDNYLHEVAEGNFDGLPRSVRVSLSHRAAKYSQVPEYQAGDFFEQAFEKDRYDWKTALPGTSPKAADGVLLFGDATMTGNPQLWRARDMPRDVSTHGVLDGPKQLEGTKQSGRNLYTVDAMAPLVWRGIVTVPESAADAIISSLNKAPEVSVGKGRTVRGLGRLIARRSGNDPFSIAASSGTDEAVLVLQSPVEIRDSQRPIEASVTLQRIANAWIAHYGLSPLATDQHGEAKVWGNVDIRFGWNRHQKGLQAAVPVLMPGSVFTLSGCPDAGALRAAILGGFHENPASPDPSRNRGFGAIAVHPGKANSLYRPAPSPPQRKGDGTMLSAMTLVLELESKGHLPSPSQIQAVEQQIQLGDQNSLKQARDYLAKQCERILEVFYDWEPIIDEVENLLQESTPEVAKQALKSLAEIAIARNNSGVQRD